MPIDINLLRAEKGGDPEAIKKSQRERFADETLVDQVIEIDEQWRKSNYKMETFKFEFNKLNKEIADKKKASKGQDKCEDLVEKSKAMKKDIEDQLADAEKLDKARNAKLNLIGNVVHGEVPIFKNEDNNEVIHKWGEIPDIKVEDDAKTLGKLHHNQIMDLLNILEMERG